MAYQRIVSRKEALELILEGIHTLETTKLPLEKTCRYIAGRDIYAPEDIPGFNRSVMDGYALWSRDTVKATNKDPLQLQVVDNIHPSTERLPSVGKGQAAGIMTGGGIPPGADAVVKEEDVIFTDGTIGIQAPVRTGQYVSRKGKDIKKGSLVIQTGRPLTPAVLGTLASLHISEVYVTKRPAVSVLAIGNELIDIYERSTDHKIVASNLHMLSGMITEHGGTVHSAKISRNEKRAIRKNIEQGLKSDILITTGGSANAHSDLTRTLIEELGVDLRFTGVSMRPGKGTAFGLFENKPVFVLPGTPGAVFAIFYSLILPALLWLMGRKMGGISPVTAILERDIEKRSGIEHLVQGLVRRVDSLYYVLPFVGREVETFSAMNRANGLIIINPDQAVLKQGERVFVQPLGLQEDHLSESEALQHRWLSRCMTPPLISIVGKSDAGKTTLLEKLVGELKTRGYLIGTIKHDVHGFEIDHEGKDSWRHKHAGAHTVVISSPRKVAVIKDMAAEEFLDGLATKYFADVDVILTEGYKREDNPKIEVFRSYVHDQPLCTNDSRLVALVSDITLDLGVPCFGLEDIEQLADLVERKFLRDL